MRDLPYREVSVNLLRQGTGNRIDPSARILGDVEIGSENSIGPESLLVGPLRIGDGNVFGPKSVVGTPAQDDVILPDQFIAMREGRAKGFGSTVIGKGMGQQTRPPRAFAPTVFP